MIPAEWMYCREGEHRFRLTEGNMFTHGVCSAEHAEPQPCKCAAQSLPHPWVRGVAAFRTFSSRQGRLTLPSHGADKTKGTSKTPAGYTQEPFKGRSHGVGTVCPFENVLSVSFPLSSLCYTLTRLESINEGKADGHLVHTFTFQELKVPLF